MNSSQIHDIAHRIVAEIPHASLRRAPMLTDGVWNIEVCHPSVQFFWLRAAVRDRDVRTSIDRLHVEDELRQNLRQIAGREALTVRHAG